LKVVRESVRKSRVVGKVSEVEGALFPSIDGYYRWKSFWGALLPWRLIRVRTGMVGVTGVRWEANSEVSSSFLP